jgi:DUF4097 and DUF4098 domain-containing protein YvlB
MTARRTITLTALLALAPLAAAAAQAGDFRWTGTLAEGKTLEIHNVNGEIDAEPASGRQIEVVAVKEEGRRGDADEVEIRRVDFEDGVVICAVYPAPRGKPENTCEPGGGRMNTQNNDTEVHFRVRVPAGIRLVAHTVNGGVDARGLRSDVDAASVNGGVTVATSGVAEASSVNGAVDVTMGRADWDGVLKFTTVNGALSVTLPGSLDADVRAQTVNGDMESDFPLTVRGKWGPRKMSGTIGRGGRSLVLETVNGEIALRRAR